MLTNPVLVSVIVMSVLCLMKVNIIISILISAIVAGLLGGIPLHSIMPILIKGMGGNAETALSYVLLGALAYGINQTGLIDKLSTKLQAFFGKNKIAFILMLSLIACISGTIIPIHIAFIPILIPPLLSMMNKLKIDRRAVASSLSFGLVWPYITIPVGYGLIFHNTIAEEMTRNGMLCQKMDVWKTTFIPGTIAMVIGLVLSIFVVFRKERHYEDLPLKAFEPVEQIEGFTIRHWGAIIGGVTAFAIQLLFKSLPLGALCGILVMLATKTIDFKDLDKTMEGGIIMMGFIAFVMMVASGYAGVLRETGGVEALIESTVGLLGGSKVIGAIAMLFLGLFVTMGIGTSFGTIPIIASIYVPLCMGLKFSTPATIVLIAVAGALGDAGSPASDTALGPTTGLNADGQHDHIWDTCVPAFISYNIPLLIIGFIFSMIL